MIRIRLILIAILYLLSSYSMHLLAGGDFADRVVFIDVGVGDSTYISAGGKSILIDAGPADNLAYHLRDSEFIGIEQIDLLIVTHMHFDHYGGVIELSRRFEIKEIFLPDICNKELYATLLDDFEADVEYISGKTIHEISNSSVVLEVLVAGTPREGCIKTTNSEDLNKASIITKVSSKKQNMLLMGDAFAQNERSLIRNHPELLQNISILKGGHHCSDTSNSEEFLSAVDPEIVICSTGEENRFGHPSREVVERLNRLDIPYLITWQEGHIEFLL